MKLIFVFLLGGLISVAVYCFMARAIPSNSLSKSDLIAIIAILATLIIGFWQIKSSIDEGTKQQKIEWLNNIHGTVNGLRGLRDELDHNLKIYRDQILPNKNLYIAGKSFHHSEYNTLTLEFNLAKNAFEYDRALLNRVMRLYAFLQEANRIFRQARIPVITEQERAQFYTQIFSQHEANVHEWNKLIQDLSRYSNDYEPFASKASINSSQAVSYGTMLTAAIYEKSNKLFLMNIGGESAQEIKIICSFSKSPESNKKILLPFLSIRQPVEYPLSSPHNSDQDLSGECKITYKSEHSNGFKEIKINLKWSADNSQWVQTSNQGSIKKGILSAPLGSIYSVSPYSQQQPLLPDLVIRLNKEGTNLVIKNNGGSSIDLISVIHEFGEIEGWRNIVFNYLLESGEEKSLPMPLQKNPNSSFGGKVIFRLEGTSNDNYKILSFKWDNQSKKWISAHEYK